MSFVEGSFTMIKYIKMHRISGVYYYCVIVVFPLFPLLLACKRCPLEGIPLYMFVDRKVTD